MDNRYFRYVISALALFLSCFSYDAKACHLAAADMYIEYAGAAVNVCNPQPDYRYKVTLVTYSYCNCGLTTSLVSENIFFQSATHGGAPIAHALPAEPLQIFDQLCPTYSAINECRVPGNSQYPGFYRLQYSDIITLPSGQSDWKFWWSSSARNPSTNLVGTGSLYIEAGMDVLANYYNNTPRFMANPLPYICLGQEYNYLNLPFDSDPWDSNKVVTITTAPLNGANNPIQHSAGYSLNSPISGYSLNNSTGTATFTPNQQGQYTISFRGSDKSSYIIRDVQIAVLDCKAPPPKMDTVAQNVQNATLVPVERKDGTGRIDSIVYICPGSEMKFNLNGWTDADTNKVYMRADLSTFNNSTFTTSGDGTNKVTSTFSWTPTTADYGEYSLFVTTIDSSCRATQPIVLITNAVIMIKVVPGINAGPDQTICELNPQPIQLFVKGTDNLRLKWSMIGGGPVIGFKDSNLYKHNPTIIYPHIVGTDTTFFPKSEAYIISTSDLAGACKATDTIEVTLDTSNTVNITPKNPNNNEDALVICRPTYMQLEALIKGRRPMNNVTCGIQKVATVCDQPGVKRDSLNLFGSPVFGEASYDTLDNESPILYTNVRSSVKQYLITKEDLWQWGMRSSSINGLSFEMTGYQGTTHIYNNFTISFKCTDAKEFTREKGFENFGLQTVYAEQNVPLTDGVYTFNFKDVYNWDTTKNLIVQICFSNTTPVICDPANPIPIMKYAPTSYMSGLSYKPNNNVSDNVCNYGNDPDVIVGKKRPVFNFKFCEVEPLAFDIKWKEGQLLSDSTIAQPLSYVAKSDRYIVQTVGRSTCIMRDTLEVYVPEHDVRVEPVDTALCLGDRAPFTVWGGYYFKWYEYENGQYVDPKSVQDPTKGHTFIGPDKTTEYRIVVSDSVWCYDTLATKIKVLPLPDVRILNEDDTVVKYGQSFQLLATGARLYNWSPVSSLNNPNISYPIARPTEDTKYIVGGIATNGCRAFDTLHVIVDKRDNLFVPSAFSPNGDGKNDVFKITNLSFQRIMEFRIFNRWGQEVYSTNDGRAGWDGNWGGVPQGIGTYSYLIRVAYPDGFVETYKGETSLIR